MSIAVFFLYCMLNVHFSREIVNTNKITIFTYLLTYLLTYL